MLIKTSRQPTNMDRIVRTTLKNATSGTWEGREVTAYFERCLVVYRDIGMIVVCTRDVGYHTSGWWKNPDYERCLHLSLSFRDPETGAYMPRNKVLTGLMLTGIFGIHKKLIWCEPPYTDDGKSQDVWHYRLFCDERWQPIKPRGEVYSRELTEAGWRSFSDVQAYEAAEAMKPC